ncbi:MAG: alanine--tRNA ligase [Candidatus Paceibacterota bacterium]
MNSDEIRSRFLKFFENRGHKIIPSASLVTSDEKGITNPTLFNSAGMQPLIPYLLGKPHPLGNRLCDVQKCVRTVDIDGVGDNTHVTFFEMLGNWSLGDPKSPDGVGQGYFKKEAINWSYEFLTSKKEGLGLDPNRLYVTVFEGDQNAPKDNEAGEIWKKIFEEKGIKGERVFFMSEESNWWQAGDNGPCGPDSEMFYDVLNKFGGKGMTKSQFIFADEKRDVVEIWNDVFMQYEKENGKIIGKLKANNIDTGAGLERLAMMLENVDNIYDTDLFKSEMNKIKENSENFDLKPARIVADHLRTSVFLIAEGVLPSNTDRGYVLRRLLRRAIRFGKQLGLQEKIYSELVEVIAEKYKNIYSNILENVGMIQEEINKETEKFGKTLEKGTREFEKGVDPFILFTSYGFPLELILEMAKEKGVTVNVEKFNADMKNHQDISRVGAEQKFKGGLAGTGEMETKYHTATHLLDAALRKVLGNHVFQKGSNINTERTRFDFSHPAKMTDPEKKKVEELVNDIIKKDLPVVRQEMKIEDAKKSGAIGVFDDKYGEVVSIYTVGDPNGDYFSKEFCGGPHVTHTGILGHFKIIKEEAVAQGVRRIKAILE